MKYVIFKKQIGDSVQFHPIISAEHTTHSRIKYDEPGYNVHSAGFFFLKDGMVRVDEKRISESLMIGPQPEDQVLLTAVLLNAGSYGFIKY